MDNFKIETGDQTKVKLKIIIKSLFFLKHDMEHCKGAWDDKWKCDPTSMVEMRIKCSYVVNPKLC